MGSPSDSRIGKPIEQVVNDVLRFDIFSHIAKEAAPTFQPGRLLQHFRSVERAPSTPTISGRCTATELVAPAWRDRCPISRVSVVPTAGEPGSGVAFSLWE